ncbi:MAG: hypothetical protein U0Y82_06130 [Thermoleophilia bacterium]
MVAAAPGIVGGLLAVELRRLGAMTGAAPGFGGREVIITIMMGLLVTGGALLVRRLSRDTLRAPGVLLPSGFRGSGLERVRVSVGPWPEPAGREATVVTLLEGGPVPVEADGDVRLMSDGDSLRLGDGAGCVRRARPLRSSTVWMHVTREPAPVWSPVRGR